MERRARLVNRTMAQEVLESSNHLSYQKLVYAEFDGPDLSITSVDISGEHRPLRTDASTRVYYILSGDFIFTIEGEMPISASDGDAVIIYRSSAYGFVGSGKYLVINGPAFQEGDDQYQMRDL